MHTWTCMCIHGTIHEGILKCCVQQNLRFLSIPNKIKCALKIDSVEIKIDKEIPSQFNH